ncbi:MAG TPA: class I SAM-dependent methyltransferase [Bdellovibrionota bacterium]|nr:class I SAM-dependent methyltransferase [Bdellovibrionota bacterium]
MKARKRKTARKRPLDKYSLYERAVQSPEIHAKFFVDMFRELRGTYARRLREDFCGTSAISCEWVKRNRRNEAVGLDLDPEPLEYCSRMHRSKLSSEQKKRLELKRMDVKSVTRPASDMIIACNFSFCVFHERKELVAYLRAARKSLSRKGILSLELAGGPGMISKMRERKSLPGPQPFIYIWDQKSFDPITRHGKYAIHFHLLDGRKLNNAFTYHWRMWTIPEVRDAMAEAGFKRSVVYWETTHKGEGTGEHVLMDKADNAWAWVAYIVGMV